ncbi:MAG: Crp/Fnr family transcriptional regulator [Bacteroidetes bacterium]|nr:Crp/Fnr family transcriptional regulator [Bacteroidota bacterium]
MTHFEYLSLFHPLSEADYNELSEKLQSAKFSKGSMITACGEIQNKLFFVREGVQMSYYESEENTHVIAFTYSPNLCAIPESFFQQTPSKYWLTCISDSEMDYITFEDLQAVMDANRHIERLFRKITEAMLIGLIQRHIELHSMSIADRFSAFSKRSPHLFQLVPHKYIASYLGINATNFSKLYNSIRI